MFIVHHVKIFALCQRHNVTCICLFGRNNDVLKHVIRDKPKFIVYAVRIPVCGCILTYADGMKNYKLVLPGGKLRVSKGITVGKF